MRKISGTCHKWRCAFLYLNLCNLIQYLVDIGMASILNFIGILISQTHKHTQREFRSIGVLLL